jgi:predicted TIM-barrel fold metal-dependent hydrolase
VLRDPAFDEVFAELDRRHAVVFVHPTMPKSSETVPIDVPGFAAEFTFDTSRAILNPIWSGTAERCQNVRMIFSHAGGTAPFLAWRWSLLDFLPGTLDRAPRGVMQYLKGFFYDTALSASPNALRSLCELVPPTQILFGTDFPFAPEPVTDRTIDGLARYDGFDEAARGAIERHNVLALLPRLRHRVGGGAHA